MEKDVTPRKISKGEQRKLKQIAREKALKAQREQVTYFARAATTSKPILLPKLIDWVNCGECSLDIFLLGGRILSQNITTINLSVQHLGGHLERGFVC